MRTPGRSPLLLNHPLLARGGEDFNLSEDNQQQQSIANRTPCGRLSKSLIIRVVWGEWGVESIHDQDQPCFEA